MTLGERVRYLQYVFTLLQSTNSINEKRDIIEYIDPEVKDDFMYIVEILAGKRKIGYTYDSHCVELVATGHEEQSIRQYLEPLFVPSKTNDFREATKYNAIQQVRWYPEFVSSIVNRTLRLGIGSCLLDKDVDAPMLAKKYEGKLVTDDMVYVTEKLDGNRCIAKWNGEEWTFTSRNGKAMYVDIDMGVLDKELVYDGEILSKEQTNQSVMRYCAVNDSKLSREYLKSKNTFNNTSGMINRHDKKGKDLVYNIFDIQDDTLPYSTRRTWLNEQVNTCSSQVRILPVLKTYRGLNEFSNIDNLLDDMVDTLNADEYGVGLAAPQVGILKRMVVIDVGEGMIELINPVIVETSGSQTGYEACLSVPGVKGIVTRPNYVKVEALNRKGEKFTVDGTELLARAFCHEIDHLDGILYVDHVEGELQSSYEDFEGEEE